MIALLLVPFVLCVFAATPDPCAVHPNCQECVSDHPHVCGWCSTPVVYKDGGPKGNHCGTLDGTHPYACYGVFSTEDCIRGYTCNAKEGICEQAPPGEGLPYDDCTKNCTAPPNPSPVQPSPSPSQPPAQTYDCDQANFTCVKVGAGHGTSLPICLQSCHKPNPSAPSPSPMSPQPAPSPAGTYECELSNYTCIPTSPGHGTSKLVCLQECKPKPSPSAAPPPNEQYTCNFTNNQCEKSKNGTSIGQCKQICLALYYCDQSGQAPVCKIAPFPRPGVPLPDCEQSCKPHNITPSDLLGVWRGLAIGDNHQPGEWDVNFHESYVVISTGGHSLSGTVTFVGSELLTVHVTHSTIPGHAAGDKLNGIYDFDGAAPEVRYISVAFGAPNAVAPKDFTEAKNGKFLDLTLWECQPLTGCKFHENTKARRTVAQVQADDPCMPEPTCTECLAHKFCGWCSVDVVYKDGTPGKHCAGFNSNTTRNQFECHGVFRTDDCQDYLCVEPQGQCVPVPLGGGKDKAGCQADCKPGPSPSQGPHPSPQPSPTPSPAAQTFDCNRTDYKCFKTEPGHGTSLPVCEQGCKKAPSPSPVSPNPVSPHPAQTYECNSTDFTCIKAEPGHGTAKEVCLLNCRRPPSPPPGPTPITGSLRGLQIDNVYHSGEYDVDVDAEGKYTLKLNNSIIQEGTLSFGKALGTVVVAVEKGTGAGKAFSGYYTQSKGRDVTHTLISFGKDAADVPTGWDAPWIKGGANGNEWVWIQNNA